MRRWRRRRTRHAELDARVEAAEDQRRQSQGRLERLRRDVIRPIEAAGRRNRFADMIRDSLREGYGP